MDGTGLIYHPTATVWSNSVYAKRPRTLNEEFRIPLLEAPEITSALEIQNQEAALLKSLVLKDLGILKFPILQNCDPFTPTYPSSLSTLPSAMLPQATITPHALEENPSSSLCKTHSGSLKLSPDSCFTPVTSQNTPLKPEFKNLANFSVDQLLRNSSCEDKLNYEWKKSLKTVRETHYVSKRKQRTVYCSNQTQALEKAFKVQQYVVGTSTF
ncbi:unnamed protein product [Enterobius vermicularis]|uniref:Homeobox domain-containing protein n=1 Tax=Enterobius vermicularis TaxID=51028 RepID=A0A0N4UXV7_ENTVE|nr:unnamed protein product [Enterobius vermicularis]